jgi:putative SOS response-associated peptidase YedK
VYRPEPEVPSVAYDTPPLPVFGDISLRWFRGCGTKADPVEGEHLLYAFLTSEPNGVVGPIHPIVMPVILTTPGEYDVWLNAPTEEALKLQRTLSGEMLLIAARVANWINQPTKRLWQV